MITTATNFTYRAHRPTVVARLAERLASLRAEVRERPVREVLSIHRRRVARAVAGTVGALGGLIMLAIGVTAVSYDSHQIIAAYTLGAALAATPIGYLVGYLLAPVAERRRLSRLLASSDEPEMDLAIVEQASARAVVATWAERWERAGLTMPLVAAALLGPLTLHAVVVFLAGGGIDDLGSWIGMSSLIVGHAHLTFAGLAIVYVRQLREGTLPSHPVLRTWGWVTLAAAIPGAALFGLPPIITAMTGAFLVYPMFHWAERALSRERLVLS